MISRLKEGHQAEKKNLHLNKYEKIRKNTEKTCFLFFLPYISDKLVIA